MRPTDAAPEFTEMLDHFSLPTTRDSPVLMGVFVGDKRQLHAPPPPVVATPIPAIPDDMSASAPAPTAAAPLLPNAKLQELMASLNPAALQSVLSGAKSPMTAAHQMTQTPSHDPYPHPQYPQQHPYEAPSQYGSGYQQHQGYHSPYPPTDYPGYNQSYQSSQHGGYAPDGQGPGPQDRGGRNGYDRPWQQERRYGRDRDPERDNGWSSRGGGPYQ